MAFRPHALRGVMGRLSVPEDDAEEIVEIVQGSLDNLATKADIARLEKQMTEMQADIAELKAWISDKLLIALGIVLAIAAVAVAAAEAIP